MQNMSENDQNRESVAAVILAAGASSRLGRAKQLLKFRGETLVHRAARLALASGCEPVLVVTGARAEAIGAEVADLPVRVVHNPDWAAGMSGTVRTGLAALPPEAAGVLFLLTDQPLISPELLRSLLAAFRPGTAPLVVSDYGAGELGVPAVFARSLFPDLILLTGDRGARKVIQNYRKQATSVPFPEGKMDVDTEADWDRLQEG